MPPRLEDRLEDRIRALCTKVIAADDAELESAILELQVALHEHIDRLRQLVVERHLKTAPDTACLEQNLT